MIYNNFCWLFFYHLYFLFYQIHALCLILDIVSLQCQFAANSLSNEEYFNLLIVALFSNSPLSGKNSSLAKNSYLLTFPDDRADTFAVCLSKLY